MQSTFIEINKINSYDETGKALVKLEDIVGIDQHHVEDKVYYDENGNVVETKKATTKDFQVLVANERGSKMTIHVDETEYLRLVKLLTETASK